MQANSLSPNFPPGSYPDWLLSLEVGSLCSIAYPALEEDGKFQLRNARISGQLPDQPYWEVEFFNGADWVPVWIHKEVGYGLLGADLNLPIVIVPKNEEAVVDILQLDYPLAALHKIFRLQVADLNSPSELNV